MFNFVYHFSKLKRAWTVAYTFIIIDIAFTINFRENSKSEPRTGHNTGGKVFNNNLPVTI